MLYSAALRLENGDELLWLGANPERVLEYLSGPYKNGNEISSDRVLLARNPVNGKVALYRLDELKTRPPVPKKGDAWIHRNNSKTIYIDEVTDRYVITKAHLSRPDSKAHLLTIEMLRNSYYKAG